MFFSVALLLGCKKVRTLAEYNRLYQKYVHENYTTSEYSQKLEKAKKEIEYYKKSITPVLSIEYDNNQFWKYLIILPNNPPEFDILKHYHIALVFCGRFADLWQGNKNMPSLVFNDFKSEFEAFKNSVVQYDGSWNSLTRRFLEAKFETNFDDPMFAYAEAFLDSPNGISRKEQTLRTEEMIITHEATRFSNTGKMCDLAVDIYRTMMPYKNKDVRPPVRYSTFEKLKQYLKNL
ncbi:hypothetical protein MNL11_07010 [Bartonella krasnovii]|nr:hypothetical protein [Bartonella krasnovii]UNF36821.1 hypothetical protein MNL11_07010 [Bartonella krasnovii]